MERITGKKILMLIAPASFRDEELFVTREIIESHGGEVTLVSSTGRPSRGMLGKMATPDGKLSEVEAASFDAVVFVGGGGAEVYFSNATALELARSAHRNKKILCAICIAPSILANAGVLKGRKATVWKGDKYVALLKKGGATYTNAPVSVDGNIITADGPMSAKKFGLAIVKALE